MSGPESYGEIFKSVNPEQEVNSVHKLVTDKLIRETVPQEKIDNGEIRPQTILYLIYWHNRLKDNNKEQARIDEHLSEYIGSTVPDSKALAENLTNNIDLSTAAESYVENLLAPAKTVDLVVMKPGSLEDEKKEVLCLERGYYPYGLALPGGFIKDTDEDNELGLEPKVFAALRIAGEKILNIKSGAVYGMVQDTSGKGCYTVQSPEGGAIVRIYPADESGYHFRENLNRVLRPSDPRHIVDTTGFRCEIEGEIPEGLTWRDKTEIMSPDAENGGFAFGHHREIVAFITSQTSDERKNHLVEHNLIREMIKNPVESYKKIREKFEANGNSLYTNIEELYPTVNRVMTELFNKEMNDMCEKNPILIGMRDLIVMDLRAVTLGNRNSCPYLPTILALGRALDFFDLISRDQKGFYQQLPTDKVISHNPKEIKGAYYHSFRYKYRIDEIIASGMLPEEIVIPTFESLSATDLLKTRGVPIRFVGISTKDIYVDEFLQSPREFYAHDWNHSYRMMKEDEAVMEKRGITRLELIAESNQFIKEYLEKIKILKTDTEEEREIKKLKKIILFEVTHEDARPFLKDIIGEYVQQVEGKSVPFEMPRSKSTGWGLEVVDEMDTGISTLAYVRSKLQDGFYDEVDNQLPQIVDPKYRTARWIAKAAYSMLVELDIPPAEGAEIDESGHVSVEWLVKRAVYTSPDSVHETKIIDPDMVQIKKIKLNEKRYDAASMMG